MRLTHTEMHLLILLALIAALVICGLVPQRRSR